MKESLPEFDQGLYHKFLEDGAVAQISLPPDMLAKVPFHMYHSFISYVSRICSICITHLIAPAFLCTRASETVRPTSKGAPHQLHNLAGQDQDAAQA